MQTTKATSCIHICVRRLEPTHARYSSVRQEDTCMQIKNNGIDQNQANFPVADDDSDQNFPFCCCSAAVEATGDAMASEDI
mmetsp:Transcript_22050/g.39098  ORF Transcript_22050/g.39098 Transcript_22050/m.39098 type:complete len:81 (-) Transcript_22050:2781-3023(-)